MNTNDFYVQIAIWSQVASSVLFIGVLVWLWFKFIQPAILAAQDRQNKQIAEAERHRDEAKAMLDLLRNEIESAQQDAESIEVRAEAQGARERAAIVAETREAGERGVRDAQAEFGWSLAAARDRLRAELLEKALVRARAEAAQRVDQSLDARLVERFATLLERSGG
jgi:F0F1-type ATP synthase membrane subunit b/b'